MIWTFMQKFITLSIVDICKQLCLYLSSYNYVPCIIAKMMMWSCFLGRPTHKYSHEIYLIILWCLFIFLWILETYTNFYEYIKYYEFRKWNKKEKLRVGRIRLEAEGLLGMAAYHVSRPSLPHGPTSAAQQPLGSAGSGAACAHRSWSPRSGHAGGGGLAWPVASNRVTRCGETSGDSTHRKRGRCRARRGRWGRTEAAARRRGGGVSSGR
jgi:hypothetical protein